MYEPIQLAYKELLSAVTVFNKAWPTQVVAGAVWRLPLLAEQKTPDTIEVEEVVGAEAKRLAYEAFGTFERDLGQAAGTVMRLPGYFILATSVIQHVQRINAGKKHLVDAIEAYRLEQNLKPEMRPRIMRRALGPAFNTNQLKRTVHAFDGAPRRITFTWAGHTAGNERLAVAKVRAQLAVAAELRASNEGIPLDQTPEYFDLRNIAHMADDEVLVRHKQVAPHPRCMLWFSGNSRWDAMIKANLPVFVLEGELRPVVSELKPFDRHARREKRPDEKSRQEVLPGREIYLPTGHDRSNQVEEGREVVPSTYRTAFQTTGLD